MGTNYYARFSEDFDAEPLHIGEASLRWTFALHVYPDRGLNSLDDWMKLLHDNSVVEIVDEDGCTYTPLALREVITERYWRGKRDYSEGVEGPNGLTRRKIDGTHCIGHGEGTWDLCIGEFS